MDQHLVAAVGVFVVILLAHIHVNRLKLAGPIRPNANGAEILWLALVLPLLRIVWAGLFQMIRTLARGTRQKPPLGPFLLAWVTGQVQTATRRITVTTSQGVKRQIQVSEQVKPPRPPGRPRKYPEGWRRARLTGRPRGRPRKAQPEAEGAEHRDN